MSLEITINKTNSILDKLVLVEYVDANLLEALINSDGILHTVKHDINGASFENEKQQLQMIQEKVKNNSLKVKYHLSSHGFGRVYQEKSLSLFSLRRALRHTLCKEKYIDIDIENCHPQILKQICEHNNISNTYLKQYVDNRAEIFYDIITEYNVTRDEAKMLFINTMYGETFENWLNSTSSDKKETEPTDFIKKYMSELVKITKLILNANPELVKVLNSKGKDKKKDASIFSIYLQEKERIILEQVYLYFKNKKLIISNDAILCFDGIMIKKDGIYDETIILNDIHENVLLKTGFNLKFTTKEMTEGLTDEDKQNLLSDVEIDESSFEFMSKNFELEHCKIINKSVYIKSGSENGELKFFTKHTLKDAYEHMSCNAEKFNAKPDIFIDRWTTKNDNIRKYDDFECIPSPLICPSNIFNTWTPFIMEKYTSPYIKNEIALQIILKHIKILCGNDNNVYEYLIKWVAQMIQFPATKTICPTLISKQGGGKGTFNKLIEKMVGKHKFLETTTPSRDVWGNFNGVMMNAFFINLNELSKKDTTEADGQIKSLITDNTMTINNKGVNQHKINSYHRFIITTNKENPIATSQDDRRNLIIRSSDELVGKKEYFITLYKYLEDNDVIRTCYDYFKSIGGMDKFNSLPLPITEYQTNLKKLDKSVPEQFIEAFVMSNLDKNEIELTGKEFYEQFSKWADENNVQYDTNPLKLGVKMSLLKIDGIKKGRHTKKGDTKYYNINELKKQYINDPFDDDEIIIPKVAHVEQIKTIPPIFINKIEKGTNKTKSRLDICEFEFNDE